MNCLSAGLALLVVAVPVRAQDTASCGVYRALLASVAPDTAKPFVVYDSVSLAQPTFAFHAYTGYRLPDSTSGVPITDSLWEAMRAEHHEGSRDALPSCIDEGRRMVRVPYDSLWKLLRGEGGGWDRFYQVFPGAPGFWVLGEPLYLDEQHTRALVYVGNASHWLAGGGLIFYLKKESTGWVVVAQGQTWVS